MHVQRQPSRSPLLAGTTFLMGTLVLAQSALAGAITTFSAGNLVISTVSSTSGRLDTAAPIVLQQFHLDANGTSAVSLGTLTLPQTSNGKNSAISGEYGSASEGILQRSANGQYLTIMGYGVNAAAFNAAPLATYGTAALGQTSSLTAANQVGTKVTTVARVVALIGANGSVDTSTALTGVFNGNNPRSVASVDGASFYVSGQATSKTDPTQGLFYALRGASTATVIDNSTDTRVVSIQNTGSGNKLLVSRDVSPGSGAVKNFSNVSTLASAGGALPTSATGLVTTHLTPATAPYSLGNNNGSISLTAGTANGVNHARIGSFVYVSPEQSFLASPTVMYVADSGQPKNGNAGAAALGEGGLQKWILSNGSWNLAYDLVSGLNLANNNTANANTPSAAGVTGLMALAGRVVNGQVQLFATSYGLNELSRSYLYGITDTLSATALSQVSDESFTALYTDPSGQTSIRGVAFAPEQAPSAAGSAVPEPASCGMLLGGLGLLGFMRRNRPIA